MSGFFARRLAVGRDPLNSPNKNQRLPQAMSKSQLRTVEGAHIGLERHEDAQDFAQSGTRTKVYKVHRNKRKTVEASYWPVFVNVAVTLAGVFMFLTGDLARTGRRRF